jgi:hypothetical protein
MTDYSSHMTDESRKALAEARLEEALSLNGLEDPRPAYRERLRALREAGGDAFERALRHYEEATLPALADDADPLTVWVEYGRVLGELTSPGRLLHIDAEGRSAPYEPPPAGGFLLLHVPDDTSAPILAATMPRAASPAQRATYSLLVERKLVL